MLNGKRSLSPELAMMMEAALGVDAAPLLAMQNEYDMLMAERNDSFMEKLKQIRRIAAIFWINKGIVVLLNSYANGQIKDNRT